jgi:hypothetical protein
VISSSNVQHESIARINFIAPPPHCTPATSLLHARPIPAAHNNPRRDPSPQGTSTAHPPIAAKRASPQKIKPTSRSYPPPPHRPTPDAKDEPACVMGNAPTEYASGDRWEGISARRQVRRRTPREPACALGAGQYSPKGFRVTPTPNVTRRDEISPTSPLGYLGTLRRVGPPPPLCGRRSGPHCWASQWTGKRRVGWGAHEVGGGPGSGYAGSAAGGGGVRV